jgi:predicted transposase YbfD/YdcC
VLGQVIVADKSDEIVAIPAFLDMLAVEGALAAKATKAVVITLDAMGCQREIARKVIDKDADYILASKARGRRAL